MDIHDVQDWMKTAPLKDVQEALWYGQGVLETRQRFDGGRKRRKDAGVKREKFDPDVEDRAAHESVDLFERGQQP